MGNRNIEVRRKRVFDPSESSDGLRILVDRFWPRGVKKTDLDYDMWAKEVTPSDELRKFFHQDPDGNWDGFADGYRKELESSPAVDTLIQQIIASKCDSVTLLYAFRNKTHNHAFILKQELEKRLK